MLPRTTSNVFHDSVGFILSLTFPPLTTWLLINLSGNKSLWDSCLTAWHGSYLVKGKWVAYLFFSLLPQNPWPKQLKRRRNPFASKYEDSTKGKGCMVIGVEANDPHRSSKSVLVENWTLNGMVIWNLWDSENMAEEGWEVYRTVKKGNSNNNNFWTWHPSLRDYWMVMFA